MDNNKVIKLNDKNQYDAWNRTHEADKPKIIKSKISKNDKGSRVQAKVKTDACGHWSLTKPDKPCLFIARYSKQDEHPDLHYAVYDEGILCVTDTWQNYSCLMEEFCDCEFYIVEYI